MQYGVDVLFSGGHLHLRGGARYPASMTVKGPRKLDGSTTKLPVGVYALNLEDRKIILRSPGILMHGRRGQTFDLHITAHGCGIKVNRFLLDRLTALGRRSRTKGQLRLLVKYGNQAKWIATARGEIGTNELSGATHNPRILKYWKDIRMGGIKDDETAWCAGFVAWVLRQHGYRHQDQSGLLASTPEGSQNWTNFGKKIIRPSFGAVAVKGNKVDKGHVGFVVGQSALGDKLFILGGNQNDSVNVMEQKRSDYYHFGLPSDYQNRQDWLPVYRGEFVKSGRTA